MKKVFVGGSRSLSRLNAEVREQLDIFIKDKMTILIGDANGIDKAVQQYLKNREYENIEVFCMQGNCRNNVGEWKVREIASESSKKDYAYYARKDQEMAKEAALGLMVWDGRSKGSIASVFRLIHNRKPVHLYDASKKKWFILKNKNNLDSFFTQCSHEMKELILGMKEPEEKKIPGKQQMSLFSEDSLA